MKQTWLTPFLFYIATPIVVVGLIASFVLTLGATYENYRLARATDQIVQLVAYAREMHISTNENAERALASYFARLDQVMPTKVVPISDAFLGQKKQKGIENPWASAITPTFYPEYRSFSLEMPLASKDCRRILLFYAKDIESFGIRRIDVRQSQTGSVWRQIYQEPSTQAVASSVPTKLTRENIYGGCGDMSRTILSLTFYLS